MGNSLSSIMPPLPRPASELQALVYDILVPWREMPESNARSVAYVCVCVSVCVCVCVCVCMCLCVFVCVWGGG